MGSARPRRLWDRPARVVVFAVAYYLLGKLSYGASLFPEGAIAVWWAPSGLALATLVRAERRSFPWYLVALVVSATAINTSQSIGPLQCAYRSVADLLEPLTASLVLRRLFGPGLKLSTLREVTGFAAIGGLLGPTVGSLVIFLFYAAFEPRPVVSAGAFAGIWFGSAVLGAVLFAPLLLTWDSPRPVLTRARFVEASLIGAALIGVIVGSFYVPADSTLTVLIGFAAFPPLLWAAVRFGPIGAARAAVVLSLLSLWPNFSSPTLVPVWQVLLSQGIYALGMLSALALSALMAETQRLRERAESQANRAEESLALLESAIRGAPFGIAFFDPALELVRANEAFTRVWAQGRADLTGRTLSEVLPGASAQLTPPMRAILSGADAVELHVEAGPDGAKRSWLTSVFPVRVRAAAVFGVGLLMIDETERKAVDEERNRLYREAQEAVKVREDFLSIASHELKTPLTPLAVRLGAIQRKLEAGEAISPESIEKPMQSLRKITELINDLLDASRIEHGQLMLRMVPERFEELVRTSAETFRGASAQHRLRLEIPSDPLWIEADRQRLTQVIANLIDNAIKYSPSGGEVRVSVRPHPEGVELVVSDEGIGIPREQLPKLFERFYRAANSSVSYGGLGLGLYITRDIVDRHGGRIWAESVEGQGSQFHVVLPRIPSEELQGAIR